MAIPKTPRLYVFGKKFNKKKRHRFAAIYININLGYSIQISANDDGVFELGAPDETGTLIYAAETLAL